MNDRSKEGVYTQNRGSSSIHDFQQKLPFSGEYVNSSNIKNSEELKIENEKLWDYLKRGEKDVEFIKQAFDKLLESFLKNNP